MYQGFIVDPLRFSGIRRGVRMLILIEMNYSPTNSATDKRTDRQMNLPWVMRVTSRCVGFGFNSYLPLHLAHADDMHLVFTLSSWGKHWPESGRCLLFVPDMILKCLLLSVLIHISLFPSCLKTGFPLGFQLEKKSYTRFWVKQVGELSAMVKTRSLTSFKFFVVESLVLSNIEVMEFVLITTVSCNGGIKHCRPSVCLFVAYIL